MAGFNVHGFRGYTTGEALPTLAQILDGAKPANSEAIRVQLAPGTQDRYSGGGYVVVRQLLEDITKDNFVELMQKNALIPLGMNSSTFAQPLPGNLRSRAASGHDRYGRVVPGKFYIYPELAPDGLWTTPTDLAQLVIKVQQSAHGTSAAILSAEMTKEMLTPQLRTNGLGFNVRGDGPAKKFSHGGENIGFICYMVGFVETGKGAVVMTNGESGGDLIPEIMRSIAAEYQWPDPRPREVPPISVDPKLLQRYAGRYWLSANSVVTLRKGKLYFTNLEGRELELIPETPGKFVTGDGMPVIFSTDESGNQTITVAGRTAKKLW